MALGKRFDIQAAIKEKGESLDTLPVKKEEIRDTKKTIEEPLIEDEKQILVSTRIPDSVLKKMNAKYRTKGMKPAQWIRLLIMEDLDRK